MESVQPEKKKSKYGKFDEYEIEHLADKMIDIEECKKDAEKMKHVMKCLKEKQEGAKKAVKSIADIRAAAKEVKEEE